LVFHLSRYDTSPSSRRIAATYLNTVLLRGKPKWR